MRLEDYVARSAANLNLDLECFDAGEDLSARIDSAIYLNANHLALVDDPNLGFSNGDQPLLSLGYLRNNPTAGRRTILRISGLVYVLYGDTVAVGDLLKTGGSGKEGTVVPWNPGRDGHIHSTEPSAIVHLVYVCDDIPNPIEDLILEDFDVAWEYDNGTTMTTPSPNTVTVTETATPGEYRVAYTPTVVGVLHRLRVGAHVHDSSPPVPYIVTPGEFQDTSPSTSGVASAESCGLIVGQAILAGVAGDRGLMFIRTQVF